MTILECFLDQYLCFIPTIASSSMNSSIFHVDFLCLSLINSLSVEESLILKLFEFGSLKFLLQINDRSLSRTPKSSNVNTAPSTTRGRPAIQRRESFSSSTINSTTYALMVNPTAVTAQELEISRRMLGATIHNLMVKRPIIAPGTIPCIMGLLKNSRDGRVVLCMRAMAHLSLHPKSKISLAREASTLIPDLAAIMRFGCDDADRVQHYG